MSDKTQKGSGFPATDEMERIAADFDGGVGFYVKDLATGANHHSNADQRFPTASICKVPAMIELFRQAEEGRLSLDDRHRLRGAISTHGTGVLSLVEDEPELTLRDYCRLMISVSDNVATDFLIELLTPKAINSTMDALGFPNTRTNMTLGRWHYLMKGMDVEPSRKNDELLLEQMRAAPNDPNSLPYQDSLDNNVATARDMGIIMERIYYGQIVSPRASFGMMEMLKSCQSRNKIPRDLDPGIEVAHKIGGSNRIQGDVGIALLPTGPLVICVLTLARAPESSPGVNAIAEISRLAVEALSPDSVAKR